MGLPFLVCLPSSPLRSPPTPVSEPPSSSPPISEPESASSIRQSADVRGVTQVVAMATAEGGTGVDPAANGGEKPAEEFDPSRMIGIIKRKALIKELAAAYHAECVARCKELLQLQRQWEEEQHAEAKMPEEPKISSAKASKRRKR